MYTSSWLDNDLAVKTEVGEETKTASKENQEDDLIIKRIGGGSIINCRPLFSHDGQTAFIVLNCTLRAYSIETGLFIREFEPVDDKIIGIILSPENSETVIGCTSTGELIFWDCDKGLITMRTKLIFGRKKNPILKTFHSVVYKTFNGHEVCNALVTYLSIHNKAKTLHVDLFDFKLGTKSLYKTIDDLDGEYYVDVIGNYRENLIAIGVHLFVYVFSPFERMKYLRHKVERSITSICGHPESDCLATGDDSGRVVVWKNISDFKPTKGTYHWHTLPCNEIIFSKSGGYMYTGGGECVLVKWLLSNPQNKAFLPRLPAPIKYLAMAPGNIYVAVSTLDNGIIFINSQRQIVSTIQNFTWSIENADNSFPAGLNLDPATNCLVFNSRTGHIQFFKTDTKTLLYNLNITDQNVISNERNVQIANTEVKKIALNDNGSWLLTCEERDDGINHKELRIKFWNFNTEKQNFYLNTVVDFPHENEVKAMKFRPGICTDSHFAVTVGNEKVFKLWQFTKGLSKDEKSHWKCYSRQSFRDLPASAANFAKDGSLLGVGFKNNLTIWNPDTMEFKCNLSHGQLEEDISQIEFGNESYCNLIVVGYQSKLAVWNIDNLGIKWVANVDLALLAADPFSEYIAALTTDKRLLIFTPESADPVYFRKSLLDDEVKILGACFVPHHQSKKSSEPWRKSSDLFFLTSDKQILTLDSKSDVNETLDILPINPFLPITMFQRMICKKVSEVENPSPNVFGQNDSATHDVIMDLLVSTPAYKLPPINTLCTPFLLSLLKKYQTEAKYKSSSLKIDNEKLDIKQISNNKMEKTKVIKVDDSHILEHYNWGFLKDILPSKSDVSELNSNIQSTK